jgi:hypothetical protein
MKYTTIEEDQEETSPAWCVPFELKDLVREPCCERQQDGNERSCEASFPYSPLEKRWLDDHPTQLELQVRNVSMRFFEWEYIYSEPSPVR